MVFQHINKACLRIGRLLIRVHRDEQGAISIASVFALMLLAMLLGMVINSGVQADHKIRLQNAADAATYSGGLVLARGMNTLSFTNHLLCDVFALTAYMREARDRSAESMTPETLAAWEYVAPVFANGNVPKFSALGRAIQQKIPREREMIRSFSDWAAAASKLVLPTLERILAQRSIPQFQRALVIATPQLAQVAADEIAQEHGLGNQSAGALSRADSTPCCGGPMAT